MAQTKFDKQVEENAESLVFGIGRVLGGRDLDGVKRTDATFWRSGTRVLPKVEGKVRRRAYKPGWRRLSFRVALGAGVWETGYLATQDLDATVRGVQELWDNRDATLAALEPGGIGAASVLTVGSAAYMVLTRERRELMREWVAPLHDALHRPLGLAEQTDPRRYLHIPKNFSDDDAEIRIDLPRSLGFSRDVVADLITQKLALEGVTFDWHPEGRKPYVRVKKTRKPPAKALFKDPKIRELVAKAPESAPIIGIGAGGRIVSVDLDAESPHILVNASTGGGKSATLRGIACQMLHHGSLVFVLDTKRISHPWAHGVDGVTYCRDIADIHDQLIELGQLGRLRTRIADELGIDADPIAIGPRALILLEEINATMRQLARYWDKVRESGDPKTSPAVDALMEILFMGRQLRMHVLLVAQSATARALGGPEVREQFATRILARYSMNAWRMLAPEVHPAPKSTKHQGRAQVVIGGSARETQVLFFTEAEAREWATTGKTAADPEPAALPTQPGPVQLQKPPAPDASPADLLADAWSTEATTAAPDPAPDADRDFLADAWSLTPPAADPGDSAADATTAATSPASPAPVDDDQVMGLREAFENHLPGVASLHALRTARHTDATFPKHVAKRGSAFLYRIGDLKKWARNRPRAASGTTELEDD
ncbi:pRL2-11 (plasmid) [Streptomyces sp. NBC_00257]|uniref:pRL2-11 n=1 Tax=unclassified Streptomyces TaxID=2593676 RepID=UPI00224D8AE0|nr:MULTISPECIES: pRL2-11 [unclassified Streptomyces]MCX5434814.1 pRL2-11 [Streptomyces sp. NBC_00062]